MIRDNKLEELLNTRRNITERKVCANCAHLDIETATSDADETYLNQIKRGKFVCNFHKELAVVTHPSDQTCNGGWMDRKVMERNNKLNEILGGG